MRHIFLFLLFFSGLLTLSGEVKFRHLDESKGLPNDQIRSFMTLDDGRMAIQTPNGIMLSDGSHFSIHYLDRGRLYALPTSPRYLHRIYKAADGRLWVKAPGSLTVFDPQKSAFIYNMDSLLKADYRIDTPIEDIFLDDDRDLWCVSKDGRLLLASLGQQQPYSVTRTDGKWLQRHGRVKGVFQLGSDVMVATSKGSLLKWNKKKRQFTGVDDTLAGYLSEADRRFALQKDPFDRLWAISGRSLWMKEKDSKQWKEIVHLDGNSNFFTALAVDHSGDIWAAGSWSGLRIIDGETLEIAHYPGLPLESGNYLSNDIQSIHSDSEGGVWIGTLWQGIAYYHPRMNPFRTFHTGTSSEGKPNESIRAFVESPDGEILIATTYSGIVKYSPKSGRVESFRRDLFPIDDVYLCLYYDSTGALWVGTYNHGFFRIMPGGAIQRYNYDPGRETNISRAVIEDNKGRFWVSVNDEGAGMLDLESGKIEMFWQQHPRLKPRKRELGIMQLTDECICIFGDSGVMVIDQDSTQNIMTGTDLRSAHRFDVVTNGVLNDTRGLTWFATDNGLIVSDISRYDQEDYSPVHLTTDNSALPSNYISAIIEDKFGQIWASTSAGLVRIITRPGGNGNWIFDLTPFAYGGGLTAGRISENATLLGRDGTVYFGGYNGVAYFNPSDLAPLRENAPESPLITSFSILDHNVAPGEKINGRAVIEKSVLNGEKITLNHDQNFFSIGFSSLDFVSGQHVQYRYRLKGYDRDWVEIGPGMPTRASYTGVPPGKYEFEVMAAGMDGLWSEIPASAIIVVKPPVWGTWWAKLIYVVLFLGTVGLSVRIYLRGRQRRMERQAEKLETARQDELNQMKFQFFTNISHEFRTPLALIMTPLSHLMNSSDMTDNVREKLKGVYNNAENLLGQVNRLLDFRKLEMGGERLNIGRCRIVQFTSYLISSFENVTEGKNISLSLDARLPEDTDVYLDSHKLRHILTNLYSNAIKFTPYGGRISTTLGKEESESGDMLRIDVSDTGSGIPEKDIPNIFGRFFQADNRSQDPTGSGIGLHLVSEYVKLHRGSISVESKEGVGSCFTILIPMNLAPSLSAETEVAKSNEGIEEKAKSGKSRILVVEDNTEFREFLLEYLSPYYDVVTATDGEDALAKAKEIIPDLVVTDLMMPLKDGLEFTKDLKEDISTSHIPVILLTAKASDEARIESYKAGADSYISKPFNFDVLLTRIAHLLKDAKERQSVFRRSKTARDIEPSQVTITSLDEKMVEKALKTVEENMDNSGFSTVQLGEALGLSRSQLYRKFESVTGMSPADFITRMRMKRAAQLLRDSQLNVSEIADMTGFNSTKYFNKHFKDEYGCTPTEYRTQNA